MNTIYKRFLPAGLFAVALLVSCIKDKGNYDYNFGNEVTITYTTPSYSVNIGDTLRVSPIRKYSNPQDTTEFDHEWYYNGELVSTKPVLEVVGKVAGSQRYSYFMVDRKSGVRNKPESILFVSVVSPYRVGWGILYEKDGKSEIAHVALLNGVYRNYTDIYKKANNGEELGSGPVMLKDFFYNTGRGLQVIQRGGQGSIEMDAVTMVKKNVTANIFTGGSAPVGFKPVDVAFATASDYLVDEDGRLYTRAFVPGFIPFSIPWTKTPMEIAGGMRISDIWDSWFRTTYRGLMHDKLNNRVLYATMEPNYDQSSSAVTVNALPAPSVPYPTNYTPLNNMGNWAYVWGGTFNDAGYYLAGALLLRNPTDQQLYYETFTLSGADNVLTPLKRIVFPGNALVTADSKFAAVKARNYLFFSGGPSGQNLYYYDAISEATPRLYAALGSKVTKIVSSSEDANLMGVGLENGTFILYDISNATLISGQPRELHRLSGLGRIADVTLKGSVFKQQ